jgi:cytoskeleton protein RodZ
VQDIESDTHQKSVSITFTKGYVRIYAKLLGIAADPLLEQFDQLHSDEKTPAKLQSFSQRVAQEAHDERWMMVTYLVIFLVVASVVIWWFQQSDKSIGTRFDEFSSGVVEQVKNLGGESSDASETTKITQLPTPRNVETQDETTQTPNLEEEEGASVVTLDEEDLIDDTISNVAEQADSQIERASELAQSTVQDAVAVTEDTLSSVTTEIEDTSESIADEVSTQTEALATVVETSASETIISDEGYEINPDGTVDVVFTFKDDCWVSVRDVNKETMAYGVKKKGRIMTVSGIPPIRVILGAPQNVEIDFGGQPVDMTVHPAGRSANFKLPVVGE